MTIVPPHSKLSRPVNESELSRVLTIGKTMRDLIIDLIRQKRFDSILALAHSQVDDRDPMAFFVVNPQLMAGQLAVIINPVVRPIGSVKELFEGCVTFPGKTAIPVLRTYKAKVQFRDMEWNMHELELRGREAQVFQHEFDHICGNYIYPWEDVQTVPAT